MNTTEINNLLSFVAMVNLDGLYQNSVQATIDYFNAHYSYVPKDIREHVHELIRCYARKNMQDSFH